MPNFLREIKSFMKESLGEKRIVNTAEFVRCIADLIEEFKGKFPSARLTVDTSSLSEDTTHEILFKFLKNFYIEVEMVVDPAASIVRMLAEALEKGKKKREAASTESA